MEADAYDLYRSAHRLLEEREAPAAVPLLEQAARQLPDERAILRLLALAYYGSASFAAAEPLLRRLVDADPLDADSLHMLGKTLELTGRAEQAQQYYALAGHLTPAYAVSCQAWGVQLIPMSNVEPAPIEQRCTGSFTTVGDSGGAIEVLSPRDVPLGGPRAMTVRRTLPQRARSLIGAWCFADHYGPDDVSVTGGMDVAPHPHAGLQTVSWLFAGEIEHRDSLGVHALVRPGEVNLMTAGNGICHSEVSTPRTTTLHGVQLWVALPEAHRAAPRDFQHHVPTPVELGGATIRVFLGNLAGQTSPVATFTPLLGAEICLDPRARVSLDVDPGFEHGILVDTGTVTVGESALSRSDLGYLGTGLSKLTLTNATDEPARLVLLGGEPFGEEIIMWWNFVGRSHDEIVRFREAWQNESEQFGRVEGYAGAPARLPAPALPNAQFKRRQNLR